ncbi:membrane dipeptidase [Olivibacter ginsenosidimutans]|uniref:Membrane dipeptidase n=1 Tax=Olivibacter ginsenosidimutans TaxID=1176537 RepID=A0ABP9CC81_9SPHI
MFIIDAHLDLSMNALEWNRDLTKAVAEINQREKGLTDKPDRGNAVVSLPELRKGNIGLVVATQIARYVAPDNPLPGWHSPEQAWAQTQGQLAWYKAMEAKGEMVQIKDLISLEAHLKLWNDDTIASVSKPIGYILSLEGADSIINLDYLHLAWQSGLRAIGPAHYGSGRYAQGTDAKGLMGPKGHQLLSEMERLRIILDVTHLCDDSFWEALDHFNGPLWASHNNCRALVNHNRQFSDEQIKALIERGAVIGGALDAWMMVSNWQRGLSTPLEMQCNLDVLIDHLDHICQLAGNSLHIGIGSDLDGAFGREQCPYDLHTIADLQLLKEKLMNRGYQEPDVTNIFHGNWLRFLRNAWQN